MREGASIQGVWRINGPVLLTSKPPSRLMGSFDAGLLNEMTQMKPETVYLIQPPYPTNHFLYCCGLCS